MTSLPSGCRQIRYTVHCTDLSERARFGRQVNTKFGKNKIQVENKAVMHNAAGGSFIVQLGDCLTTFTVSMLYLLMRSFSGLSLVKPFTSCACDSSSFLVCFGRLEDDKAGALWLSEVRASCISTWEEGAGSWLGGWGGGRWGGGSWTQSSPACAAPL